jgi:tetratricopeptide (TPR) repeat protein
MPLTIRSTSICVILAALALIGGGCSPEAKKAKLVENADKHYADGNFDRAEVEYLNLLRLDPQSGRAIGRLGLIYSAQGRTGRAIPYLMRGHELQPNDLELRLKIGQLYFATAKRTEARAEANFILDRNPLDPEAPALLIATLANPEEAETLRKRLLDLPAPAPTRAPVLSALAALELRLGRITEAENLLAQAKAADATYAGTYSLIAAVQSSKKNLAETDAAFKQAAALSPPRSPRQIQYAQFKIRTGDLAAGGKLLEEITGKTPDYVPAWVALAELSLAQNKIPECEAHLAKALGRDPQNLEALILQGRLHNTRNESAKALALFEKLVETFPRVPVIHQELGRAYANNGEMAKAINSLTQAVALAPNAPEAVMLLAQLQSRKGDHNTAVALLRKVVDQRPDLPQAKMLMADIYRSQGNLEGALSLYRQLEQQNPQNAQIALLVGLTLAQQGNGTDARSAFERSFTLSPDSPTALEQLVNLDLRDKKYPQATSRVDREMAKNPKLEGFGQLLLAKILLAQDDKGQAETHLKRAIELMPDSPTAYFLLAGIYARSNEQEKALAQLTEVITRDPKQVTALMLISVIQDQRGNHKAAREGYEKLLSLNPRLVVALNNLAYLLSEKFNDLAKAQELAQKARQLAPNDPHNADTLGWILHKKRQYPWALSLLLEAADKLPTEAEIQFHLGLTHYVMGNEAPARIALQRALDLDATATWAVSARQAVSLLDISLAGISSSAKPALDKALAERPDDPVALFRLAALQEREGKTDQAIASLETALTANPHNVNLLLGLARLHGTAKNSAKALEYAKAARKQAPEDAEAAQSLGRLAYENGDHPWAASLLQEAARKQPDSPDLQFDLGLANYSIGRVGEAQTAMRTALSLAERQSLGGFTHSAQARQMLELIPLANQPAEATKQSARVEQILQQNPSSVPALMASGAISEQRFDTVAARQSYEKALAVFPDFLPAKYRLVVLGSSLKSFEQKVYDWAVQIRPTYSNDVMVAKTLGIQSYLKGDYARSVSLLKESAASQENDAEVFCYLGLAQHRLKDASYAKSLQRALELNLQSKSLADEARKVLDQGKNSSS